MRAPGRPDARPRYLRGSPGGGCGAGGCGLRGWRLRERHLPAVCRGSLAACPPLPSAQGSPPLGVAASPHLPPCSCLGPGRGNAIKGLSSGRGQPEGGGGGGRSSTRIPPAPYLDPLLRLAEGRLGLGLTLCRQLQPGAGHLRAPGSPPRSGAVDGRREDGFYFSGCPRPRGFPSLRATPPPPGGAARPRSGRRRGSVLGARSFLPPSVLPPSSPGPPSLPPPVLPRPPRPPRRAAG